MGIYTVTEPIKPMCTLASMKKDLNVLVALPYI